MGGRKEGFGPLFPKNDINRGLGGRPSASVLRVGMCRYFAGWGRRRGGGRAEKNYRKSTTELGVVVLFSLRPDGALICDEAAGWSAQERGGGHILITK
jgi:hypothetical protein